MGSFSWLKADKLTNVENIAYGKPFKFLIPKEFGGGFIKDIYQDCGRLGIKEDGTPKYDMYELLAIWNRDRAEKYGEFIQFDGELSPLKEIDKYTRDNRSLGIDIGCYDKDIAELEYPLKLVSVSYTGTYEDLDDDRSYGDPEQGCGQTKRKKNKRF